MSILSASGRSTSGRRFSQANHHGVNPHMQWPSPATLRLANVSMQGRRRALDLYDVKDVLFSHEQMKKATQATGNSKGARALGWVSDLHVGSPVSRLGVGNNRLS